MNNRDHLGRYTSTKSALVHLALREHCVRRQKLLDETIRDIRGVVTPYFLSHMAQGCPGCFAQIREEFGERWFESANAR